MTQIINSKTLATRWRMSPATLARWRHEGRGPLFLKIGGKILYRLEDIENFERQATLQETKKDDGIELTDAA